MGFGAFAILRKNIYGGCVDDILLETLNMSQDDHKKSKLKLVKSGPVVADASNISWDVPVCDPQGNVLGFQSTASDIIRRDFINYSLESVAQKHSAGSNVEIADKIIEDFLVCDRLGTEHGVEFSKDFVRLMVVDYIDASKDVLPRFGFTAEEIFSLATKINVARNQVIKNLERQSTPKP